MGKSFSSATIAKRQRMALLPSLGDFGYEDYGDSDHYGQVSHNASLSET